LVSCINQGQAALKADTLKFSVDELISKLYFVTVAYRSSVPPCSLSCLNAIGSTVVRPFFNCPLAPLSLQLDYRSNPPPIYRERSEILLSLLFGQVNQIKSLTMATSQSILPIANKRLSMWMNISRAAQVLITIAILGLDIFVVNEWNQDQYNVFVDLSSLAGQQQPLGVGDTPFTGIVMFTVSHPYYMTWKGHIIIKSKGNCSSPKRWILF
jgi:hypothetical protein